jgi:threonine aldolase
MIDLRSDTVTKPTPGMLAAMLAAEVGDDVYGEDPTVNRLEAKVAEYLGMEAALFVPSGTMGNQLAIRVHCQPGDEIILETTSHIYLWEAGGPAVHSGVTCRTFDGEWGIIDPARLADVVRPDDHHSVRTRLVCLENTHNRGGGTVYPLETVRAISAWAREHGLALHLDGARLWNAVVASGIPAREWCRYFDTVMVAFSKGLGAPVGSVLAGPRDFIAQARKIRKLFGGAMRQVGYLAAACLHGMDHHIDRLADDHANAMLLAEAVAAVPGFTLAPPRVETNLVWFDVDPTIGAATVVARLREHGVLVSALGSQTVRACTHLNVSRADCEKAAAAIRRLAQ